MLMPEHHTSRHFSPQRRSVPEPRTIDKLGLLLVGILLTLVLSDSAPAAEWLTVRGRLTPVNEEEGIQEKSLTLQVMVEESPEQSRLIWTLEENGAGSWSWLDHFGQLTWDERGSFTASSFAPAMRYESGEIRGTVPLTLVLPRPADPLAVGLTWEHDGLKYEVTESARVADQPAWLVNVRSNFGEKRKLLVTMPAGLVVEVQETVFLGQGDRYRLNYRVAERRPLVLGDWEQAREDFERLSELRARLEWRPHEAERKWSEEQRTLLRDTLSSLTEKTRTESLTLLLRAANQESRLERGRAGALEAMRRRALEAGLPDFQLEPIGSQALTREDLQNAVTVFHFWDYRDSPLREPYGQAGYLDFLSRKYDAKNVRVVGVVVPPAAEELRQAAVSARRFSNFMNLAYPLFVDKEGLLGRVGDPRLCDASLPLFVAVGRDGKILHYHAGHYAVDNNRGLVELEKVIETALKTGE
jgi:hypothetical protein